MSPTPRSLRGASRGVLRWSGSTIRRYGASPASVTRAGNRFGTDTGETGVGSGWGRRCGLDGPQLQARQPASMAQAGRLESGVAPARRASHARHPGGSGAPPAGYYGLAARSSLTVVAQMPPRSAARGRDKNAAVERREASPLSKEGAPRLDSVGGRVRKAGLFAPLGAPLPSQAEGTGK